MGKASVTAKSTCGFSLDLVIKEKLIELSKYMNASMTVVVSYLINDGYARMMKEKVIKQCGRRSLVIGINHEDYDRLVELISWDCETGFATVSDVERYIDESIQSDACDARRMSDGKQSNKYLKPREKSSS